MEKISSKSKLEYPRLQKIVKSFIESFTPEKIKFKYQAIGVLIKKTQQPLIQKIIVYITCKQLNISKNQSQHHEVHLLKLIRDEYYRMSVEVWKKQLHFEMWMVFVTKIISNFYHEIFIDINTSLKLEAEIYIILVHILIGLNVNAKSYELLNAKYLHENEHFHRISDAERLSSLKKHKLKKIVSQSSTSFYRNSRCHANVSDINPLGQVQNSDYSQLKSFLKTSLHFNSLPKVKSYKKVTQKMFYDNKENQHQTFNTGEYETIMRKKMINSLQNSVSFQTQILTHNISLSHHGQKFSIPHRIQFKQSHGDSRKKQNRQEIASGSKNKEQKLINRKSNTSYLQWMRLMKKMKNSQNEESMKLELSSLFLDREKKQQSEQENRFQLNESDLNESNKLQERLSLRKTFTKDGQKDNEGVPTMKLDYFTKDFKEVPMSNFDYFQKKVKTNLLKSRELKHRKAKFEKNIQDRTKKIQYSIFQLPEPREKIANLN